MGRCLGEDGAVTPCSAMDYVVEGDKYKAKAEALHPGIMHACLWDRKVYMAATVIDGHGSRSAAGAGAVDWSVVGAWVCWPKGA